MKEDGYKLEDGTTITALAITHKDFDTINKLEHLKH